MGKAFGLQDHEKWNSKEGQNQVRQCKKYATWSKDFSLGDSSKFYPGRTYPISTLKGLKSFSRGPHGLYQKNKLQSTEKASSSHGSGKRAFANIFDTEGEHSPSRARHGDLLNNVCVCKHLLHNPSFRSWLLCSTEACFKLWHTRAFGQFGTSSKRYS